MAKNKFNPDVFRLAAAIVGSSCSASKTLKKDSKVLLNKFNYTSKEYYYLSCVAIGNAYTHLRNTGKLKGDKNTSGEYVKLFKSVLLNPKTFKYPEFFNKGGSDKRQEQRHQALLFVAEFVETDDNPFKL